MGSRTMNEIASNIVNCFADIAPGKSAAGFELGLDIKDFSGIASTAINWNPDIHSIAEAAATTPEWLFVSGVQLGMSKQDAGSIYYYKFGAIKLHFNPEGRLASIAVYDGYKGKLFGSIQVGDKLSKVCDLFDLIYDDVEELHFPVDDEEVSGIMFQAEEESLDTSPDQLITGILIELKGSE
jgi:hypothetical protein